MIREGISGSTNSPQWPRVAAPGKVFLAGEYGVLCGGPSLVCAVDRYVKISPFCGLGQSQESRCDPLINALLSEAAKYCGFSLEPPHIDTSELYASPDRKMGLGSSAAKAAGIVYASFLLVQRERGRLPKDIDREHALRIAWHTHRSVGGGSGADVAASVLGGTIRFRLAAKHTIFEQPDSLASSQCALEASADDYYTENVELPAQNFPIVILGQQPLSTRSALSRLDEAIGSKSRQHLQLLEQVHCLGENLCEALLENSFTQSRISKNVREVSQALLKLTRALGLEAESAAATLDMAGKITARFGGAAKPSGAGGGDLILVFVPSMAPEERGIVKRSLMESGLEILHLSLDNTGVSCLGD